MQVKVGNLSFELGSVLYFSPSQVSNWWPIIVGVVGGVLVVAIVTLVVVFMRKSWYNERQYRRLQSQLDALESSVRNECKQGNNTTCWLHRLNIIKLHQVISYQVSGIYLCNTQLVEPIK